MASFNSLEDFLGGNIASTSFSQTNIGSNFSIGGLVAEVQVAEVEIVEVPEPGTLALFSLGLAGLARLRKQHLRP